MTYLQKVKDYKSQSRCVGRAVSISFTVSISVFTLLKCTRKTAVFSTKSTRLMIAFPFFFPLTTNISLINQESEGKSLGFLFLYFIMVYFKFFVSQQALQNPQNAPNTFFFESQSLLCIPAHTTQSIFHWSGCWIKETGNFDVEWRVLQNCFYVLMKKVGKYIKPAHQYFVSR